MRNPTVRRILTINTGSSSLKIAVYELGLGEGGQATVHVMKSDEDLMIARHIRELIGKGG